MLFRNLNLYLLALLAFLFVACGDDEEGTEFLFDREVSEMTVLNSCADESDTSVCFRVRYHYPIETDHLSAIYMWLDTLVVDDTSKAVTSKQLSNATEVFEFSKSNESLYGIIDLTGKLDEYIQDYDSLQVALYCKYSDDKEPGSVQRVFLHFGDNMPPSRVEIEDSTWTTGMLLTWHRPADQTNFYDMVNLSGPITGYNIELWSKDTTEDLRNVKIKLETAEYVDSTESSGNVLRHSRIRSSHDSIWVDSVGHSDKAKNYLRIAILDGKGYDTEDNLNNRFRMTIEGLRSESQYTIGITAWDSAGLSSGTEGQTTVEQNKLILTTDSIAPLMPKKVFVIEDTAFPGYARLDSNNRVQIFWSESVDPYELGHKIVVDSILRIPVTCQEDYCYRAVKYYMLDLMNPISGEWERYTTNASDTISRYTHYAMDGDSIYADARGSFIADTIRWVAPGDTLIIRLRAVDSSRYYSVALVDTIVVSPGALAKEMECPDGFMPVSIGDTTKFCMERLEHQDDSSNFMVDVLYSEALAACEAVSASGFTVSLCKERDWELACLSGGTLAYGVVEEDVDATEYLFTFCNVGTNDSLSAADIQKRDSRCMNPNGVRDLPGQYQEWVMGRSEDTAAVVKGGSYKMFRGLERENLARCTNRSFPYYTRPAYTKDTVYLYMEGTKVDTAYTADTSRTLFRVITADNSDKDYRFKDSLQFFDVQDSSGNSIGTDYALYSEYKKGGEEWLANLAGGLVYVPSRVEVVFLTGAKVPYREVSSFYKSTSIGFRCCAYPE